MIYREEIIHAIGQLHGCAAHYLRTVPVAEVFQGRTIWEGDVEVFALSGHPKAQHAYAWGYPKPGGWEITTVLAIPPVDSPQTAVKLAIASHCRS